MTKPAPFKNSVDALLTPQDSVLILIDHQPFQFANLHSHEPMMIVNNVIGLGKAAKVFNVPAIQAAGEGYEVYAVADASGGVSVEAHEMGMRRMMMAGVTPMNWLAVAGEWQRDWARQDSAKALGESVLPHTGGTGTAFAWELQLLGQATGVAA